MWAATLRLLEGCGPLCSEWDGSTWVGVWGADRRRQYPRWRLSGSNGYTGVGIQVASRPVHFQVGWSQLVGPEFRVARVSDPQSRGGRPLGQTIVVKRFLIARLARIELGLRGTLWRGLAVLSYYGV